ncbi:nucleolar pre-ribosomal-associated protein 2 [Echria macrotheca]|uniref:Nucleolar pre-ribosomal-associated protein 2 n=1 Tax=Echria macrotheca TaxID=438768 RepID=A0AAJ0BDP2_9PEZI|nr:nucleolar pre-ribosomal-associated protein 2 [Echria macrotheca]
MRGTTPVGSIRFVSKRIYKADILSQGGEFALFNVAETLDSNDFDAIPDKLAQLEDVLQKYSRGSFCLAEKKILRWLLKNMTGDDAKAERVRRFRLTWHVLEVVFTRIDPFSLAELLADLRFVALLQQVLRDISASPESGAAARDGGEDVEMTDAPVQEAANPRKRKRPKSSPFDLSTQKTVGSRLQTAEAVFKALKTLLFCCDAEKHASPDLQMGARHIKSLFWLSAADVLSILSPLLRMCDLAASRPDIQSFSEQSTWISTLAAVWDLHIRRESDITDVVTHISAPALTLLGKLTGSDPLGIDTITRERWAVELRRFVVRNLILPSKAAFVNRKSQDAIELVVEASKVSGTQAFPVLFELASKSYVSNMAGKRDHDAWVQAVFDAIVRACPLNGFQNEMQPTIERMVETAAENSVSLSISSLQSVCREFALWDEKHWGLLLSLIKLDPDVFLISDEGQRLQEEVLEITRDPKALGSKDADRAASFIVLLAKGYANARDLSSFLKLWFRYLATGSDDSESLWARQELSRTVASVIERSLRSTQLEEIMAWLSEQTAPFSATARVHIVGAISAGLCTEELVDAANMKTMDGLLFGTSEELSPDASALRWDIAEKALARATLSEAGQIWAKIKPDVEKLLRKVSFRNVDVFPAFRCCVAVWLANHPGGPDEEQAASLVCSYVEKLGDAKDKKSKICASKYAYVGWILFMGQRLLSLLVEKTGAIPKLISSAITEGLDVAPLLKNENNVNKPALMNSLIGLVISMIESFSSGDDSRLAKAALEFLLQVPREALGRDHREAIMTRLISQMRKAKGAKSVPGREFWRPALSLMIKVMEMPTFYEGMTFGHLEDVGRCLLKMQEEHGQSEGISERLDDFLLLARLATHCVREMTSGTIGEREKMYLADAAALLQSPAQDSEMVLCLTLQSAFLTVFAASSVTKQLQNSGAIIKSVQDSVISQASAVLERYQVDGLVLVAALGALSRLDRKPVQDKLSHIGPSLLEKSQYHFKKGFPEIGWEIRTFVAKYLPQTLASPLEISFSVGVHGNEVSGDFDITIVLRYVDAVVGDADEETKLGYLESLLKSRDDNAFALSRLVVIHRLLQHIKESRPATTGAFDLAEAESILCLRLAKTETSQEFIVMAKCINLLLDQHAPSMTQWNIDLTLDKVGTTCYDTLNAPVKPRGWEKMYDSLCQIVGSIIRHHRIRLNDHFALLISALQSLLNSLLSRPQAATEKWVAPARSFARLLTLVCEPTDASVARSQAAGGGLDSEKAKAKEYAGQFMYLVLMEYIKLRLEHLVSQEVVEALQPGVYSVLDITPRGVLMVMNDAMDRGGRAFFKEFYKQYQRFGRWSGI